MAETSSQTAPKSIRANIVWNTVGNFIYLFCQWLLSYLVVKILGFYDAGIFSLSMTIANTFSVIATYTMRNYQASDLNGNFSDKVYICSRLATCLISLACCFVFVALNGYDPFTFACIMIYMLFKTSEALSDIYQGIIQRKMRMDYIGISFAIKGIVTLVLFLVALLVTHDLLLAIIMLAVASFAIVLIYDRSKARLLGDFKDVATASLKSVSTLLLACLPLAIYGFLFNMSGQAPRYFIELLLGEEPLGFYTSVAMPVVIVQVSASFIFSPLITPLAQALSDDDKPKFRNLIVKVLLAIAGIAVLSLLLGYLLGDPLLVLLFGQQIEPYCYLLLPLIGCTIMTAFSWFLAGVLTVMRKLNLLIGFSIISALIVLAGCIPFINLFGMNGASFIMIASLSVFCICCISFIGKAIFMKAH